MLKVLAVLFCYFIFSFFHYKHNIHLYHFALDVTFCAPPERSCCNPALHGEHTAHSRVTCTYLRFQRHKQFCTFTCSDAERPCKPSVETGAHCLPVEFNWPHGNELTLCCTSEWTRKLMVKPVQTCAAVVPGCQNMVHARLTSTDWGTP